MLGPVIAAHHLEAAEIVACGGAEYAAILQVRIRAPDIALCGHHGGEFFIRVVNGSVPETVVLRLVGVLLRVSRERIEETRLETIEGRRDVVEGVVIRGPGRLLRGLQTGILVSGLKHVKRAHPALSSDGCGERAHAARADQTIGTLNIELGLIIEKLVLSLESTGIRVETITQGKTHLRCAGEFLLPKEVKA